MAAINESALNIYVVCEGEAHPIQSAPAWLNQDNWMSDWIFVGAYSEDEAIAIASRVDEACNKRRGRIAEKGMRIQDIRSALIDDDPMSPAKIYQLQGNRVNSNNLVFRQGWVTI